MPMNAALPSRPKRRRRHSVALAAALGVGAALAALPGAATATPIVMAKIVGGTSHADDVSARTGLALEGTLPEIGWATYAVEGDAASAHRRLLRDPAVSRIDFALPGEHSDLDFLPRDIIFQEPGTVAVDGLGAVDWKWHWIKTNFPAAWDISRGSSSVKVVVIDSEFDTEHPDLKTKFAVGRNFDSGTADYHTGRVRAADLATAFHGSHVSGLVGAASDNAEGGPGACFDCVVIPYKIGFSGSLTNNVDEKFVRDLTEALLAAGDSDGVVINMSLGTSRDHAPLRAAVDYARSKGKVIVASAGNSQLNGQGPSGVPNYPGAYPGVIAVAATRPDDSIAPFSTNGDFVDIAAPGDAVLSTWDTRLDNTQPPDKAPTHGIGYRVLSGTSMASPIVAGLAALVRTVRPDLTPDEVELVLEQSADDLGAVGKDPVFGAGRINALRALQVAQAYVRPTPPPPPPDTRAAVRFFWSCTRAGVNLAAGKPFARVPVGARLDCKGRTKPAIRNATLEIQRYARRGGWRKIGTVKTTNKGRFGFTRRLGTVGNWRIRVAFGGDAALLPSGALGIRARAVPRSTI